MKCQDMQDQLLTGFLDNELSSDDKKKVEGHLMDCPACREFLTAVKRVNGGIMDAPLPQGPSEHVWHQLKDKIEAQGVPVGEKLLGWWEDVLWGFRPTFVYGSLVSGLLVICVVVLPYIMPKQQALLFSDKEEIARLVYPYEDNAPGLGLEEAGKGAVIDNLL